MSSPKSFRNKLDASPTKKLLALDGGGILGAVSIEYLVRIEDLLRGALKTGSDFVLADYFDYVAGTSTGAIIATCVTLGMPARDIQAFYRDHGREMFDKAWLFQKYRYKYSGEALEKMLRETIDAKTGEAETKLGSEKLRTLLMVVLRNATTDSAWPLSSNPFAKYNDRNRASKDCNLDIPLWQIVRGSTAAPTYFPPEVVTVGPKEFVFVDGGITVYNNPAFQLFLMATVAAYRLKWPAGQEKMLVVSVGTGEAPDANARLRPDNMNVLYSATHVPSALMAAANAQQDFLCRVFGRCVHGAAIDREVHNMIDPQSAGGPAGEGPVKPKLFTYARYNPDLTQAGVNKLLPGTTIRAADLQMDAVNRLKEMTTIGAAAAGSDVKVEHFADFLAG
jgi:patatin-like phospholipase/acyl hydrolase